MKAASSEERFSMDKRSKVPIERHLRGTLVRLREQKRMKRRRCKGTRMVPNTQTGPPRKRTATARHTSIEACRDAHAQLELIAGVATSDHRTDSFFFFFHQQHRFESEGVRPSSSSSSEPLGEPTLYPSSSHPSSQKALKGKTTHVVLPCSSRRLPG